MCRNFHIIPAKHLLSGESRLIAHDFFLQCALFFIYIVADHHVHNLFGVYELLQCAEHLLVSFQIHPVVTVYHLEIQAGGIAKAGIDRLAVTAVFLVYGLDNCRILCCIAVCNGRCSILRSVIYDNDFHILAARKQRTDTVLHICL